jgi:hypothetical protein
MMSESSEMLSDVPTAWFAAVRGERMGPLTIDQIAQLVRKGTVHSQTNMWKKGMAQWLPAAQIPELASFFGFRTTGSAGNATPFQDKPAFSGLKENYLASLKKIGDNGGLDDSKSILGSLFDLSFSSFIATRVIRFLYLIAIILSGLYTLSLFFGGIFVLIQGFRRDSVSTVGMGLVMIVFSPIAFLLLLVINRIYCEILIVFFRIAENTQATAKHVEKIAIQTAEPVNSAILAGHGHQD